MQKEALSSFMDGELIKDDVLLTSLSSDRELLTCWHRYHIARDAIHSRLHKKAFAIDVSEAVSLAISDIDLTRQYRLKSLNAIVDKKFLLYSRAKRFFGRVAQAGFAACVTLSVIVGVQYYTNRTVSDTEIPLLNTMPIGISISQVGGGNPLVNTPEKTPKNKISQEQYEKIYFLLENHELQKCLNAAH